MTTKKQRLVPLEELEKAADVLRVLAHPHRLAIVQLLTLQRHSVGQLAVALDLPPNVVSQHLSNMKAHGIAQAQRDGRAVYYRVTNPNALQLLDCIRKHGCGRPAENPR